MLKQKIHIFILYFVLIITFSHIVISLLPQSKEKTKNEIKSSDNRIFFWDIYPELVIPNTGKVIEEQLYILDINNNKISINELSQKLPLLIFRYSQYDCHLCTNQVLDKLQTVFKGNEGYVCLIVDGLTPRDFKIKYKDLASKIQPYFIDGQNLGLSLENKNLPFLFMLYPDPLRVDKIFVPFKEHPHQTDAYLKNVKRVLND